MTRRSSGVARVGDDPKAGPYCAAVVTAMGAAAASAMVASLVRVAPDVLTTTLEADAPTLSVLVLVLGSWPARRVLATLAASCDAILVLRDEQIPSHHVHIARHELTDAAAIARRVCLSGSVVSIDELRPYRSLVSMPRPELESLVRETLGGILNRPKAERERLIETLWARHQHDTDSGAVRALRIDPRTMRRRRDRIHELTGLDPARQRDRFRLDLGLHALRVVARVPVARSHIEPAITPYPTESQNPGIRPTFGIASRSRGTALFAPHSLRPTLGTSEREELMT